MGVAVGCDVGVDVGSPVLVAVGSGVEALGAVGEDTSLFLEKGREAAPGICVTVEGIAGCFCGWHPGSSATRQTSNVQTDSIWLLELLHGLNGRHNLGKASLTVAFLLPEVVQPWATKRSAAGAQGARAGQQYWRYLQATRPADDVCAIDPSLVRVR
jgi:hypothetical protein